MFFYLNFNVIDKILFKLSHICQTEYGTLHYLHIYIIILIIYFKRDNHCITTWSTQANCAWISMIDSSCSNYLPLPMLRWQDFGITTRENNKRHDLQWGKKVFSQPPIVQVLPLKKMREACNFHHRYTSTMRDKIRKINPENHIVGFFKNLFTNYGGK